MDVKISAVTIGSINIDEDALKNIGNINVFKVTDKKSCDEILAKIASDDIVFIISDGREVYYAEKFFSRLPALKIYLVTQAQAADNKNLSDVIIQFPAQDFTKSIHDVINAFNDVSNVEGFLPTNFDDIKTLLKNSGKAFATIGEGSSVDSALKNAMDVIEIKSARSVVMNFKAAKNSFSMSDAKSATEKIQALASDDVKIFWGATVDDSLGDKVKVAIIAGKFNA